ncbi:MAG: hypothetical protein GXO85_12965 [Chlorobi bacterium]|nr:hypothetical protein [Chlorobiota bacterium]
MGFTTWSFGPSAQDVADTYNFIANNSDIYVEHIDRNIPWKAWMNSSPLPTEFVNDIDFRLANKIQDIDLCVSISLLNMDRSDLAEDFNGTVPSYSAMNDKKIEDAYFKHVNYIVEHLQPKYLVISIEVNELKLHSESKWNEYKMLIGQVKSRIKQNYPTLEISESITLHNLYQPDVSNTNEYINDVVDYMNKMDFVSISYYPFFKNQHSKDDFQKAFDLLHSRITKPIAFVETAHIAENLVVPSFGLNIKGSEREQNDYLETLLVNAQENNYKFITWWAYKDFDALWETFPPEVKDLGKIWRDTGLVDEKDKERLAFQTWETVFKK